jgi:hypothetical protein
VREINKLLKVEKYNMEGFHFTYTPKNTLTKMLAKPEKDESSSTQAYNTPYNIPIQGI